ncbi:MAG: chloride channel protein [Ignavibacteriales bacterium]|nr:chloride channel protein [Ignavibacteriales bacterium]
MTEYTFMIIIAFLIGIVVGLAAVGTRILINWISSISFSGDGSLLENIIGTPWFYLILIPVIGGLIVGPIIHFFAPEAKGHGVPEVMSSILMKGGRIRSRVAVVKSVTSAITIGTGGSVGREGPIIQIGAGLGSTIGQLLKFPTRQLKTLVGCGAAAGIAAAFNAPIAGALFALEIILMDFAVVHLSPIIVASVMATVVSRALLGNFVEFAVPTYQLASPYELSFYLALGVLTAVVSYLFIKLLYFSENIFDNKIKFPDYLKPMIGGLGIGLTALVFPQVLGMGYEVIDFALHSNLIWYLAILLVIIKIIATSLTLGSGGSGGVFAPALFIGAMLGCFFGVVVNYLFPNITADPGAYALVAMGGIIAGTMRAPITAIIMVFELTLNYEIILPLMITCIISTLLSTKLSRESIYTLKLLLQNIKLKEGTEINIMESIFIKEVYTKDFEIINFRDNFNQIFTKIIKGRGRIFPVTDDKNNVVGIISVAAIRENLLQKDELQDVLIASDIFIPINKFVTMDDNCQTALDLMHQYDCDSYPVVEKLNSRKLIGMVFLKDIHDAYQKEIERKDIASSLASKITMKEEEKHVHFIEGYSIAEIIPPKSFIGKSIRELEIRKKYGVDVLSIKQKFKGREKLKAIPNPDYIIETNDLLIIAGEIKNINIVKNIE